MSKFVDYYRVLGVNVDATNREIRVAYIRLAKEQHPDVGGSHVEMRRINKAYETLTDEIRRAAYDKIHRLESQSIAAQYKMGAYSSEDANGVSDMSDDEIDSFMNSVYAEYANKPPEPSLHKKAASVVKNHLHKRKRKNI